jgi:hypothetical protein
MYIPVLGKFDRFGDIISTHGPFLRPMTFKEASTFISKQSKPYEWILVRVRREVLIQCRNYWLKNLWEHYHYRDGYFHICSFHEAIYFEELIQNA